MSRKSGAFLAIDIFADRFRSERKRKLIQNKRFRDLVNYVRKHSPYYAEKLAHLPEEFTLTALPVMTKSVIMENFDRIVTDPEITLEGCNKFMLNHENRKKKYLDKYVVATTSGSTGVPLVSVLDPQSMGIFVYTGSTRLIPSNALFMKMFLKGFRMANLVSDRGFYLGNGSLHQNIAKVKNPDKLMQVFDILNPVETIVEGLNEFDPSAMHCYPSFLELLTEEKRAGRLRINPMMILCGGEKLREDVRREAQEVFGVKVYGNYSCTEAGSIGYECVHQRLHINEDWLILEAVDEEFNPVPPGVRSSSILITNLGNYSMPFIRYEVSDQVIFHTDPCPCGKKSRTITVEGRNSDNIQLMKDDGSFITLTYMQLLSGLKTVEGMVRYQIVAHKGKDNLLEIRFISREGYDRQKVYEGICDRLTHNLEHLKAPMASYRLSDKEPGANPRTGKFSALYQVKEAGNE